MTNLTKKGIGIDKSDSDCDAAFEKLKNPITQSPILVAPDWKKPFRGHVDASQLAVGGTLTKLDDDGRDRVIAFYSKKLSLTEADYTANDRELLGLISFLERFRCDLEGASFEIFTDNQVLKYFFTKPKMSRKEARWLENLGNFGIFPINLKPGKIHVLGDKLFRAPHVLNGDLSNLKLNDVEVLGVDFEDFIPSYEEDQFFGLIVKAMNRDWPKENEKKLTLKKILPLLERENKKLYYHGLLYVPRKSVSNLLQMAHDSKISGHFALGKTLSRLKRYHWRHKVRDVRNYIRGCIRCQQYNDSTQKKLSEPTSLEMPERRWGSLGTDFIVGLPNTKNGFDATTTWVDRLTRRVHFIPSHSTDTAVDVARSFFKNICSQHGIPENIVSDRDLKFVSKFWKRLMNLCDIQLKMSSSKHPLTDGASEVMRRMIENYLRCYFSYHQNDWVDLFPAAEFAYNSAVSEDLGMSPFELDLGWNPKSALELMEGSAAKGRRRAG